MWKWTVRGVGGITLAAAFVVGAPRAAAAQPAATSHDGAGQDAHGQPPAVVPELEYPLFKLSGFADVDFSQQDRSEGPRGFTEGQFVLHLAAALSPRVNFFGELSFTPRGDAGLGTPAATGFNAEVERVIIRFDQSDQLKMSFGRYHTPINWWNTAFHHGQWLQTTISRPEMVQFGGKFIPVHFVGALVEGSVPAGGWNLGYQAGVGNGRGAVVSRAGDAGDNNGTPASLVNLFVKPDRLFGLQIGGSAYFDRVSLAGQPDEDERILAAHAVWQHEDPELIAEFAHVQHTPVAGASSYSSLAYYAQAAYRLPAFDRQLKPYARFEHIDIAPGDPVFAGVPNLDGTTLGVRYDASAFAAIKVEGRFRQRTSGGAWANGAFAQIAFTF